MTYSDFLEYLCRYQRSSFLGGACDRAWGIWLNAGDLKNVSDAGTLRDVHLSRAYVGRIAATMAAVGSELGHRRADSPVLVEMCHKLLAVTDPISDPAFFQSECAEFEQALRASVLCRNTRVACEVLSPLQGCSPCAGCFEANGTGDRLRFTD